MSSATEIPGSSPGLVAAFEHLSPPQAKTVAGLRIVQIIITVYWVLVLSEIFTATQLPDGYALGWGVFAFMYGLLTLLWNFTCSENKEVPVVRNVAIIASWCTWIGIELMVYYSNQPDWTYDRMIYIDAVILITIRLIGTYRILAATKWCTCCCCRRCKA